MRLARPAWRACSGGHTATCTATGRLLQRAGGETVEHGWIEAMRAMQEPHGEGREKRLRDALDLARRFGDPDLEFEALGWLGVELVFKGRVEEGMLLFDEALAAVCAGESEDLYVVEGVFCGMFWLCELTHDVVRADQWIRAAHEAARDRKLDAVVAFCRAHYGGILTAAGRWEEAEAALQEAAQIFGRGYLAGRASVMVRLADLRVRQGRLEEAAVLLQGLDQRPDAARPLGALHLARGDARGREPGGRRRRPCVRGSGQACRAG